MDRWKNKVAVVTGASSGIGAAIAKNLVENGLYVVGMARRSELIEEYAKELVEKKGKLFARRVDMGKENEIVECFEWVTKTLGPVHILINNAGVISNAGLLDGDTGAWRSVLETNILGYAITTREAYKVMVANNIDGHVVNINSVFGHKSIYFPDMGLYGPSKFAITSYTDLLKQELTTLNSHIKITSLTPGCVDTNIFRNMSREELLTGIKLSPKLRPEDVANAVEYVLATPPHVQISELTIQPVNEVC